MEMKAGDEEDRSNLVHAAPPYTAADDDVMVDLSCFDGGGGGGYDVAAAAMEEADHQDLMDNAAAIFCDDLIPPLPDFQCMSSSSSSSSSSAVKPVAYRSTASSSNSSSVSASSSTSWAVLRSDGEENRHASVHHHHETPPQTAAALSSTASVELNQNNRLDEDYNDDIGCMDVMETLGYMDLLDENGQVWDYSDSPLFDFTENKDQNCTQEEGFRYNQETENNQSQPPAATAAATENENNKSEDLALVFLEWLKSNKESISAEDLRSIKLKKSTIENAAKRLGNGKEGMKRLLQLILEWVKHHQLQRKRRREEEEEAAAAATLKPQIENQRYPVQYPAQPYQNLDANLSVTNSIAQPNQMQYAGFDPMMANGYIGGDPYGNNGLATTWAAAAPYCMNYNNNAQNLVPVTQQQPYAFDPSFNQYPYKYYPPVVNGNNVNGVLNEGILAKTGSSATKEARKKRMARQRRFLGHHRHHHHHNSISNGHHRSINGHPNQISIPVETSPLARGNAYENFGQPGVPNWAYWQNVAPPPPIPLATNAGKSIQGNEVGCSPLQQSQSYQRPIAPERRQGPKPEKNLRFLLQKVLKQSDVGSLGRIVLPKKEAEIHLPQLTARDGINIAMEDIGTMHVWNMRYRFWPNNKSRMYLLENTGEFVKSNGLQEGDFIVIYSDIKCGKYMIRGVKVRQQDPKSDPRRSGKAQKKNISTSISSPRKETVLPAANMDHQQMYN